MWTAGKLTDVRVRAAGACTHGDGGGLYLAVKRGAAGLTRSWLFRYSIGGRGHWTGLGAYPDISLQRARQKAQECRQQLYEGGIRPAPAQTRSAGRAAPAAHQKRTDICRMRRRLHRKPRRCGPFYFGPSWSRPNGDEGDGRQAYRDVVRSIGVAVNGQVSRHAQAARRESRRRRKKRITRTKVYQSEQQ